MYNVQAEQAVACTPSDSVAFAPSSVYVGATGNVQVTVKGSPTPVIFINVASGSFLPVIVVKVWNTNTTATNIILLS